VAQIQLLVLAREDLLAVERPYAGADERDRHHAEQQRNQPEHRAAVRPTADDQNGFELNQGCCGQQHEAGQQIGRAHAGGMAGNNHCARDHHDCLECDQYEPKHQVFERQPLEE